MGDKNHVERGFTALAQGAPLDKAGNIREAAVHFKEGVANFETALRSPSLAASKRKTLRESVDYYRKRIEEIEEELEVEELEGLLPEVPSARPIPSRSPTSAASRLNEEEARGRRLLTQAIDLEEKGSKSGWVNAGLRKRAGDAYARAAEALISARRLAGADAERVKTIEKLARDALSRAEELKKLGQAKPSSPVSPASPAAAPAAASVKPRPPPRSPTRPAEGDLAPEEVGVLKESSIVNGKLFLPWVEADLQEAFRFSKPWTDPDGLLPLSPRQKESLIAWKRPSEIMGGEMKMISNKVDPLNIKQDVITDCSFVASLCIASAMEGRVHKRLITGIIYPQDARGKPIYNPDGKYVVKLTINGVRRKVVVDDLLPIGDHNRLLCSASIDQSELWVSIVEKAYLKVNGGYDFPGGNSGVDLFALTGWVPEQIFFEEHRQSSEQTGRSRRPRPLDNYETKDRVWDRLVSAHDFGDCLITVATGPIGDEEAQKTGLVPEHAYAVLDVKEVLGVKLLQVKNPWSRKRWKGNYSAQDTARWTPELKAALRRALQAAEQKAARQAGREPVAAEHEARMKKASEQADHGGVFWIDFESIFKYFHNVFLNWNPGLFSCRTVLHSRWPVGQGPQNDTYNLGYNPQFTLIVRNGGGYGASGAPGGSTAFASRGSSSASSVPNKSPSVWVLLTRHVTRLERDPNEGDFLTMHVYSGTQGKRVYYPDDPMFRGIYTNNQHSIIRFDLPENTPPGTEVAYTLVVSQYVKKRDVRFTVNVYCTAMVRLSATPLMPEHRHTIKGAWDKDSAGGALGRSRFLINPQYAMVLTQPRTKIHVQLEAPREYSVNVTVVSAGGMRIDVVAKDREALTTGLYRAGFCYAEGILPAGTYTVIVSTYKHGQMGGYVMKIATSSKIKAPARIPGEGEGMAKQVITGQWTEGDMTAAGCANFGRYLENPRYLLRASTRTSLLLRIVIPESSGPFPTGRPAVNVAVFPLASSAGSTGGNSSRGGGNVRGPIVLDPRCKPNSDFALASSNGGVYMDSGAGAGTARVEVEPGEYVVIVSTFSPQEAQFVLTVHSLPALPALQRLP